MISFEKIRMVLNALIGQMQLNDSPILQCSLPGLNMEIKSRGLYSVISYHIHLIVAISWPPSSLTIQSAPVILFVI